MLKYESVAITGPTASGKTGKAVALARALDGEIISADSRQVYTGMDLGTGKDLEEYGSVPFHLIDIAPAGDKYNLHKYLRDFHEAYSGILERGKIPVICGGTGMYIENAICGMSLPDVPVNSALRATLEQFPLAELTEILSRYKQLHNTTDVDTVKRAVRAIEIEEYYQEHPELASSVNRKDSKPLNTLLIALDVPRDVRRARISQRLNARLEAGMVEEVRGLIDSGVAPEDLIYYGLEYKFLTRYVLGEIDYAAMHDQLEIAIHQFAKRQLTWLRGMERRGLTLHWLPYDLPDREFTEEVMRLLLG